MGMRERPWCVEFKNLMKKSCPFSARHSKVFWRGQMRSNWMHRMSRMQSRASARDQVTRTMDENRRKKWFLWTRRNSIHHSLCVFSRNPKSRLLKEGRTHPRHVFFVRIECIECHECSRERVHGTKWRELWMRIEEKSDSYRQEGTASLIRFLERSRRLPKRTRAKRTCTKATASKKLLVIKKITTCMLV